MKIKKREQIKLGSVMSTLHNKRVGVTLYLQFSDEDIFHSWLSST